MRILQILRIGIQNRKSLSCWRRWLTPAKDSTSTRRSKGSTGTGRHRRLAQGCDQRRYPGRLRPLTSTAATDGSGQTPRPLHPASYMQALRADLVVVLRRGAGLPLVLEPSGRQTDTAPLFRPLRGLCPLRTIRTPAPWPLRQRGAGSHRRIVGHGPAILRTFFTKARANQQQPTKSRKGRNIKVNFPNDFG